MKEKPPPSPQSIFNMNVILILKTETVQKGQIPPPLPPHPPHPRRGNEHPPSTRTPVDKKKKKNPPPPPKKFLK